MASTIQNGENIRSQTVWKNRLFGFLREGLEGEKDADAEPEESETEEPETEDPETEDPETEKPVTKEPETKKPPTDQETSKTTPSGTTPPGEGTANKPDGGMFDKGLTSDANYKNVNLPSLVAPTHKSNSWKPPINQTYTSRPNGLNTKTGSTSDSIYSPANDQDFIQTTIAKIADIITPPPPVPLPKPTRPTESSESPESFQTNDTDSLQEPLSVMGGLKGLHGKKLKNSSDVISKQKRLFSSWRSWSNDITKIPKLGKAITLTMNSIYETFYIPELIAVGIVNPSYNLSDIKSFYSREDYVAATTNDKYDQYNQDVVTLTNQIKLFVITAFSFFAVFNWWYLIIYTQHYLDINNFLVSEDFIPINYIFGPALGTTAGLNYFLLGKRLQKKFYESVMEPIINNKWISFPVFLLVFMALYQTFSKHTSASFEDTMKGESNKFFNGLLVFGFIYYFFGVQSKALVSPFWVSLFRITTIGFIFSFIYLVILFILMMTMLKFSVLFVILFFMFYSYWSIIIIGGGPQNLFTHISRMITDTSETTNVPNPLNDRSIAFMNWLKKNLTNILIAIIYFGLIIQLMDDTSKNIISATVKNKCHTIYTLLLIVHIFMIIWLNRGTKSMVNIDDILSNVNTKETSDKTTEAFFDNMGKVGTIFGLVWSNITNSITIPSVSMFLKTTSTTPAP
jgi:hypothetical protein